ncbi:MAG: HDOD domain-containing protein [Planctomycetes bacterium]|nr:HDOD domain-containing protein [Planctomycetota bacterium]
MKKILFVDTDPKLSVAMAQLFSGLDQGFEARFAASADAALASLESVPCDIVVAELGLPETNGGELLSTVRQLHPRSVRVLLSEPRQRELAARYAGEAHESLPRGLSQNALLNALLRAAALHDVLNSERLMHLVGHMKTLPSMPGLYLSLIEAMKDPNSTIESLGEIIARDIGMTARVLQIVNSAVFGLREKITSPGQAATFLGLDTLRSMVLSVGVFSQFEASDIAEFSVAQTWEHSMEVAAFTRAILAAERCDKKVLEEGFLAGMMHDCGKLVLANNRAKRLRAALLLSERDGLDPTETERRLFGASHAGLGAYLLCEWGMPSTVMEAVCFHHTPAQCREQDFSLLCALHAANSIAHADLDAPGGELPGLDWEYLERLGLARRVPHWIEACREARTPAGARTNDAA